WVNSSPTWQRWPAARSPARFGKRKTTSCLARFAGSLSNWLHALRRKMPKPWQRRHSRRRNTDQQTKRAEASDEFGRAGIAVFRDMMFLAAGPKLVRHRGLKTE